ncbi:hypothetical protein D3C80_1693590 [compost metagenome]
MYNLYKYNGLFGEVIAYIPWKNISYFVSVENIKFYYHFGLGSYKYGINKGRVFWDIC